MNSNSQTSAQHNFSQQDVSQNTHGQNGKGGSSGFSIKMIFYGFMLLSFFFGAGNLIFPPVLGMDSGSNFMMATVGFVVTAIALPMMTLVAIAKSPDGMMGLGRRVHPVFALIFSVLIYLSIGAMYGIPRAANVGYEMGFKFMFDLPSAVGLPLYVLIFFGVCYFAALHSSHLVDLIGKFLTPILLVTIGLLCALAFANLSVVDHVPTDKFADNPLSSGIIEGYFTMDALAALAFGSVLANSIARQEGHSVRNPKVVSTMISASLVAGFLLAVIYFCLAWIGSAMYTPEGYKNGAVLLSTASTLLFGKMGNLLFGLIVMLACLTTCIGLINACASFAERLCPRLAYPKYVLIFTVLGAIFANLGLESILAVAVPILVFLYPISIALVVLSLFQSVIGERHLTYVLGVGTAVLFATHDLLKSLVGDLPWQRVIEALPMADLGLAWIVPSLVMAVLGFIIPKKSSPNL